MSQVFSSNVLVENEVTVNGAVSVTGVVDATGSAVSVTNFPATQPVSGTVAVNNFPATQTVDGTVNVGTVSGVVQVITAVASSATVNAVVLPATTNTTLLAANANRKSAIIFCPKAAVYFKYGATASATSFTFKTTVADTTLTVTGYTGQIDMFGPATTVNVTELV